MSVHFHLKMSVSLKRLEVSNVDGRLGLGSWSVSFKHMFP